MLTFSYYKYRLFSGEPILQLQQRFKSEAHNVCTEEINEIAKNWMIKDYKLLIEFHYILMKLMLLKYVKERC